MTKNLSFGSSSRTTSTVWSHFTLVEESTKAQCNYCDAKYKRASGNTTNLHKHLQKKHPSKVEHEAESTGEMDKFVTKEIPLHKLIIKICASSQKQEKLVRQCEPAHLPNKELISNVKTRWNSTYAMIERTLNNTVTADRDLRKWELVDSEWKLLEKINLLHIFSHTTNHISHSQFPIISNSVPVYNWLMDEIEDLQTNKNTNEVIKIAAKNAMKKIQKYYHYTSALVYNISTDNDWEEEYITKIRTSIFNIYNTQYAPLPSITIESDQNKLFLGYPILSAEINILEWWKVQYDQN
ncbi:hypothetical protein C1646_750105 [Rhizophagus diaphanus]|nr:hypothetical protein C1646_750105 [Rhizophagus diaphanus] [Rhizophagus sp. MUCL 43196]